ncbi:MAG: hypothetical protein LKF44_03375 [Atopobiaceae bacterium]|jgi:hypothetical protein|nr:hypothetical protein [Atopobiaceae bacterium]
MKKSNWIVYVLLVLVSAFLLWLWYYLGFNKVDSPFDLVLSIVWWVGVAALVWFTFRSERRRQAQIRTIYVSPDALFNSERGLVSCPDPEQRVTLMADILDNLKYDFHKEDMPEEKDFDFRYVVRTEDFKEKDSEDGSEATTSDAAQAAGAEATTQETVSADATEVVPPIPVTATADDEDKDKDKDKWKGSVVRIDWDAEGHQTNEENDFDGKEQLGQLVLA